MKFRETATSRIFGLRFTTNGVLRNLRNLKSLDGRCRGFTGAGATATADDASRVTLLEEATERFEEELGVGQLEALNRLGGVSMMSSKLCFLLACDAGMMPIAFLGRTAGTGGVSSRGWGGGVGTRIGGATISFALAIRRACSGFTLNYTFGSCESVYGELDIALTRVSPQAGAIQVGSSVDCRRGG